MPGHLKKTSIPILDQEVCKDAYYPDNTVTDGMICAGDLENGGHDHCYGDSGGPVFVTNDDGGAVRLEQDWNFQPLMLL